MDAWMNVASIVVSGLISYCIARWVNPRACLKVVLTPYNENSRKVLGGGLIFKKGNVELRDVHVLKLTISTGWFSGVRREDFHSGFKPRLNLTGFRVVGFNTSNNDRTRFDLPLCKQDDHIILINVNWIRRRTRAEFFVIGQLEQGYTEKMLEARFFPGLAHGVSVKSAGSLITGIDCQNFKKSDQEQVYETLDIDKPCTTTTTAGGRW